jgi:hypothetical protein
MLAVTASSVRPRCCSRISARVIWPTQLTDHAQVDVLNQSLAVHEDAITVEDQQCFAVHDDDPHMTMTPRRHGLRTMTRSR